MEVRFRSEATKDLAAIHAWIAVDRPEVAERVVDQILRNIETMALFPCLGRSGAVAGTLEWITPGLPYIVVYQVDAAHDLLIVLAVFHTAQDRIRIASHLVSFSARFGPPARLADSKEKDMTNTTKDRIRDLNDAFRKTMPRDVYLTAGVTAQPSDIQTEAIWRVKTFDAFTEDNDPHGEHDFGAFDIAGQKFFWKIDCYDLNLEFGSDDPADEAKTRRVLTIMLADEY